MSVHGHLLFRRWCEFVYLCPLECWVQRADQQGWTKGELRYQKEIGGFRVFHPAFSSIGFFLPDIYGKDRPQDLGIWIMIE